ASSGVSRSRDLGSDRRPNGNPMGPSGNPMGRISTCRAYDVDRLELDALVHGGTIVALSHERCARAYGDLRRFDHARAPCNSEAMRLPFTFGLLLTLTAVPALAEAAPRRYHYRDEYRYYPLHEGLFFRVAAGLGGEVADDDYNDVTLDGGS